MLNIGARIVNTSRVRAIQGVTRSYMTKGAAPVTLKNHKVLLTD